MGIKVLTHSMIIWLFASLLSSSAIMAQEDMSRLRPPDRIDCPRDHLTSYTGEVVQYHHSVSQTMLRISTDWGTIETVNIAHPGSKDPSAWFLINGKTFEQSDWQRVETSAGELRTGVRATAWVCDDGRTPIIDWLMPRE